MRMKPPPDIPGAKGSTATEDLLRGIWKENPTLVLLLGMCPTMAITNSMRNSVAMGVTTAFVMILSAIVVSAIRKLVTHEVRVATYILIIATFVQLADILTEAYIPDAHKALGAFIPLIVGNCLVLGRQEAFSSRNTVWRSTLDAIGMSAGFTLGLSLVGTVREILGSGTWFGIRVMPAQFEPWVIMNLPPGGFLGFGLVLLAVAAWRQRQPKSKAAHAPAAAEPAPHCAPPAAAMGVAR
jgi:electron transport complex protein RnfE